jgi:hypothetical protein
VLLKQDAINFYPIPHYFLYVCGGGHGHGHGGVGFQCSVLSSL